MNAFESFKQGASYAAFGLFVFVLASRPAWGMIAKFDDPSDIIPIVLATMFGCVETQFGCL